MTIQYQAQSKTSVCYNDACIHTEGRMAEGMALLGYLLLLVLIIYVISRL